MTDLVSAIARGSRTFAAPIAQAYASGNRTWQVELRRPGAAGGFNRDTGQFTQRASTTYYSGPARLFPASSSEREVGDEDIPFNNTRATIDFLDSTNSAHPDWTPRTDDILVVMSDAVSALEHLANRVFEIVGVNVGGYISTGWSLDLVGAAPSREGDTT